MLVLALTAFALFNVLAFKQGAHVHIYYQFYLAVPLALAAGLWLGAMAAQSRRRLFWGPAAFVVAAAIAAEGCAKLDVIHAASFPHDERQIAVARQIAERTRPDERVVVVWHERSSFRQLTYYADRDITVVPDLETARCLHREEQFSVLARVEGGSGKASFVRFRGPRSGLPRSPSR